MEFIGLSPAGLNGIPAEDPAKDEAARAVRRARHGPRPARRPAVAASSPGRPSRTGSPRVAATGGSTNGVLHLLGDRPRVRHPARHRRVRRRSPTGRRSSPTCSRAGGSPRPTCTTPAASRWSCASCSSGACSTVTRPTVDGRTIAQIAAAAVETPGQEVVVPIERPLKPTGGLAILRGSLAPGRLRREARRARTARASRSGPGLRLGDGLLRGRPGPADQAGRRRRDPLRGPGRRSRDAGDAERHRGARRRGPRRLGRAAHRRPVLRRHARADDRPRRAGGGARRPDRARRGGRRDRHRRRPQGARPRRRRDEVARRRRARWTRAAAALRGRRHGEVRGPRQLGLARARSRPGPAMRANLPATGSGR